MTAETLLAYLHVAAPEVLLAVGALALLMIGVFAADRRPGFITLLAIGLIGAAGAAAALVTPGAEVLAGVADAAVRARIEAGQAFGGALVNDAWAIFAKVAIAASAVTALVMSGRYMREERLARFEYPVLMTLSVLGMMIMVSANDLLTLYIGLELQSLPLYVLAAFNRDSLRASEAGLKYFVLGALSSGLLLYGASLIYGFSGHTGFDDIAQVVMTGENPNYGVIVGLVFLICGLAFKVSAAPFHMWTPDVYEGAPTPVTAFFAAAPKIAAMALFARAVVTPFPELVPQWTQVVVALAALSMAVGSFGALVQRNVKRLMAYSSIANMGFALVALSAGTQEGVRSLMLYMVIYVITVIGVFACILSMRRRDGMVERIDDLAGLSRTHTGLAVALTALLFSLAGIPPLAGFFGKFFAFKAAVDAGLWPLVVFAAVMSVVSAFYYLRLIKLMWFDRAEEPLSRAPRELSLIAGASAILVFPVLIAPGVAPFGIALVQNAAAALF